jgi:hypothetical protein
MALAAGSAVAAVFVSLLALSRIVRRAEWEPW